MIVLIGLATKALPPDTGVREQARQPPVLTAFAISDGAATAPTGTPVPLAHTVVGTPPTEYRVSERADFVGAPWQPYQARPVVTPANAPASRRCAAPSTARRLKLFLQVRSVLGQDVRIVNGQRTLVPLTVESNVLADEICVTERD